MRLFVALDIPEDVRHRLSELCAGLRSVCPQARWARTEGAHVTLKFIGETPPETVERIKAELAAVRSATPVELTFRCSGFFPNEKHPRVLWAGIEATPNLAELAAEVERRLETLGLPREQRLFRPHLTLARFNSAHGLERLRQALRDAGPLEFGSARTGEFHLYRSELKRGGAEYTRLASFSFAGDAR